MGIGQAAVADIDVELSQNLGKGQSQTAVVLPNVAQIHCGNKIGDREISRH